MIKMAFVGNDEDLSILNTVSELFKMAGITVFNYKTTRYGTFRQLAYNAADVFIAPISFYLLEQSKMNIDVLVFSKSSSLPKSANLNLINENAIVIVNADDKEVCKYLNGTKANLLTYGFNPKASITASSIEESMERRFIQLCIQRSFKTISGLTVEAQEIPIAVTAVKDGNILNEIAAITAALTCGVNLRTISLAY